MATFRGVAAVGTGVLSLLEDAWARDPFVGDDLGTSLVGAEGLRERPFEFGVTMFVYRVAVNGTQRTAPPSVPGRRRPLPVEVDFLLTPWARSAEQELELLGWTMRALDDEPLLTPSLLNRSVANVFTAGELAEVVPATLSLDDHYRIWDALEWDYQTSASYTARVVRLESVRTTIESGPVLERDLELATLGRDA
jgi:hypothetical protein